MQRYRIADHASLRMIELFLKRNITVVRPVIPLTIQDERPQVYKGRFAIEDRDFVTEGIWESWLPGLVIRTEDIKPVKYVKWNFSGQLNVCQKAALWEIVLKWRLLDLKEWTEASEGLTDIKLSTLIMRGGKGSGTGFHIDASEAMNVAFPISDDELKAPRFIAMWYFVHIDKIKELDSFLTSKAGGSFPYGLNPDPETTIRPDITPARFELLKKMFNSKEAIFCFQIEQFSGDLIKVPAGWCHCVANYTDHVKIAWDQIIVENVPKYNMVYKTILENSFGKMLISDYVNHMGVIQNAIVQRSVYQQGS